MVVLRINGIRTKCPTCWADVTTNIFLKIRKKWEPEKPIMERNRVKLFGILTGTNYEKIEQSEDYALESAIYEATNFVYYEAIDFNTLPVPKSIIVGWLTIDIPKNLGSLTIGQNVHVRQAINQAQDDITTLATVAAIYLQPFYHAEPANGKMVKADFDIERAKEIEPLLLSMPITTIYPIGFFFLKKLAGSGTNSLGRWLRKIRQRVDSVRLFQNSPTPIN